MCPALTTTSSTPTPPSGCETSSLLDTSLPAMSMSGRSSMSSPMTSEATRNAISALASAVGPLQLDLLDGLTTGRSGPDHVPASRSAKPGPGGGSTTNGISGLTGSPSYESANLQLFLESRLQRRLGGAGLTLWRMTWRRKATPLRRPYCQLALSEQSKSVKDFGFWPTPRASGGGLSGGSNSRKSAMKRGRYLTGRQNPAFLAWLMMYPAEWVMCAASATRLSRTSGRNSSAPSSTASEG